MKDLALIYRLSNISKFYNKAVEGYLTESNIDRHYLILFVINKSKRKLTQKEVSGIIHIKESSMVKIIDDLEEFGYIKRVLNEKNRRQNFIFLTEKSLPVISLINTAYKKADDLVFKDIPKKEVKVFKQSLDMMMKNLIGLSQSIIN